MNYTYKIENNHLEITLIGEIDHHNAKSAREGIDFLIDSNKPSALCLDLSKITFCDSSGLGLVMGRMKKMNNLGGKIIIRDPSPAVDKILSIAGMDKLLRIEKT